MSIQFNSIDLIPDKMARNYNVVTSQKAKFIQLRADDKLKEELKIVADLRGLTMSSLILYLVKQAIREEKEREPQAFGSNLRPLLPQRDVKRSGRVLAKKGRLLNEALLNVKENVTPEGHTKLVGVLKEPAGDLDKK